MGEMVLLVNKRGSRIVWVSGEVLLAFKAFSNTF
jgi:hypothetical protein